MDPVTPDVTQLKALTHPVRIRMLGLLRSHGPATASQMARRLGLNSGATSYHLRQLAEHGFVEEASDLGNNRERWWRASAMTTSVPEPTDPTDEGRDATDAFYHAVVGIQTRNLQVASARRCAEPGEWRVVSSISDIKVPVTAAQAAVIQERFEALLWEVMEEFDRAPGPIEPDERRFNVVVATFADEDEKRDPRGLRSEERASKPPKEPRDP